MKRAYAILAAVLLTSGLFAQSPQKMSYQAVIRDALNHLVTTQVGMQISILQGSESGTAVYVETQTPTPNINGLVTIEIGTGTTTDDFSSINWTNGPYFLKTETDPAGGTNYTITGTSELLSVPYALHAKSVTSYSETDPKVGVNTTNYLSKWNGTALVTSTVFDNGKVGIGTASPDGYFEVTDKGDHMPYNLIILGQTETSNRLRFSSGTNYGIISVGSDMDESKGLTIMHSSGYIGMGTSDPSTKLDVIGVISATGGNSTNWNTAYGWGDHAAAGYQPLILAGTTAQYWRGDKTWQTLDKTSIGLGNVDNTTDLLKPVSTATQTALDLKAPIASPAFTGAPLAPTATAGTNTTQIATTEFVTSAVVAVVPVHYVGELYSGGVVFWVDHTGNHGLICSMIDLATDIAWSDVTTTEVPPPGALSDWDGQTNTTAIVAQSIATSAADLCNDYTNADYGTGIYSDWYLPSKGELNDLWNNFKAVQKALDTDGNGTTTSILQDFHWSSSQWGPSLAWAFHTYYGYADAQSKSGTYRVRAVRAF